MLGGIIFYHNGEAIELYGVVQWLLITEHSVNHYTVVHGKLWNVTCTHRHYIQKSLQAHGIDISVRFE